MENDLTNQTQYCKNYVSISKIGKYDKFIEFVLVQPNDDNMYVSHAPSCISYQFYLDELEVKKLTPEMRKDALDRMMKFAGKGKEEYDKRIDEIEKYRKARLKFEVEYRSAS